MTSPNLGLVTTDLAPEDVFDIEQALIPDLLALDQALGGLAASGANLLVNPGFDLNQRGAASYNGHGVYSLDRWMISYSGGVTLVVGRDPGVFDALSTSSGWCVFTRGAGTAASLEQLVESWESLKGATVTFRVRAKCNTPNALRAAIQDGVAAPSFSAYHSGGGGWETLTVTKTLDPLAITLKVAGYFTADCTAYLDNATLVLGSTPLPFAPLTNGENLRRCERYYEVHGGAAGFPYLNGPNAAGAAEVYTQAIPFRSKKGGTPTVTRAGTWSVTNAGQPTVGSVNQDGYQLQITSAAAGSFQAGPNSADDLIAAEWNPS